MEKIIFANQIARDVFEISLLQKQCKDAELVMKYTFVLTILGVIASLFLQHILGISIFSTERSYPFTFILFIISPRILTIITGIISIIAFLSFLFFSYAKKRCCKKKLMKSIIRRQNA